MAGITDRVTFVVHNWGSAIGFDWVNRHREAVRGLAYMEAIVRPLAWDEWPAAGRRVFEGFRSPDGEELVLEKNVFVERVLPGSVLRELTETELDVYRRPYREPGESRRPTLTGPRELPIDGQPADVVAIVDAYADWLVGSGVPKLFVDADPSAILTGAQRAFCLDRSNQEHVTVPGLDFIPEDSPDQIGQAVADSAVVSSSRASGAGARAHAPS